MSESDGGVSHNRMNTNIKTRNLRIKSCFFSININKYIRKVSINYFEHCKKSVYEIIIIIIIMGQNIYFKHNIKSCHMMKIKKIKKINCLSEKTFFGHFLFW